LGAEKEVLGTGGVGLGWVRVVRQGTQRKGGTLKGATKKKREDNSRGFRRTGVMCPHQYLLPWGGFGRLKKGGKTLGGA